MAGGLLVANAALGGTASFVSGTTQIVGTATHTDTTEARETLSSTSTLPSRVTAAASGGNLKAADAVTIFTNAATLAVAPEDATKNFATAADAVQTVKESAGIVSNVISNIKSTFLLPPPAPGAKPGCAPISSGCY